MTNLQYGFEITLRGVSYADAVQRVTDELKKEGFGVLTEIDVKETLKEKLDVDFRRYVILGACNPPLAKQALEAERQIGLLLPCNAVVQEGVGGGLYVAVESSQQLFQLTYHPRLKFVAAETERRLRMAVDGLK